MPAFQNNKGIYYMVISVACFSMVNVIAKSLPHIPVHELIFFRSLLSFAFCVWYVKRHNIPFWGNNRFWLVMRGVLGLTALSLFFLTVKNMPLATASVIQYLSPVFTIFVAMHWNNQSVKRIQWLFLGMSFLGVILIKGLDTAISPLWLGAGVLSAFFAGLAYNAIIKSKGTDHPMTIVMYFPMVATPVTGVICLFDWVMPQGMEWFWLLMMGVITQAAQYYTTIALNHGDASKVTPWTYVGAIFALINGYFFFDEPLVSFSLLGMVLIVAGVILNARVKNAS